MRSIVILLLVAGLASWSDAQYRFPPVYRDYASGMAESSRTGKPLVTFVGYQPREVEGAIVAYTLYLPGFPAQCVVVSSPTNAVVYWKATLHGRMPTDGEIDKEVSPYRTTTFRAQVLRPVAASTVCRT